MQKAVVLVDKAVDRVQQFIQLLNLIKEINTPDFWLCL